MRKKAIPADEIDEVERLRQVRRSIEQQFATTEEFFNFLMELDAQARKDGRKFATPGKKQRTRPKVSRVGRSAKKATASRKRS